MNFMNTVQTFWTNHKKGITTTIVVIVVAIVLYSIFKKK